MKKNLLTLLTFALVVVNLVLTAIIAITIVPEVQKVNNLVTTVANAIDLDLQAAVDADSSESVSLADIYVYDIPNTEGETLTVPLKKGSDGKQHYALIRVTLSLNMNSEAYTTYQEDLDSYQSIMRSEIIDICTQYTIDEWSADQAGIQRQIRDQLNARFGQGFVASVGFSTATVN